MRSLRSMVILLLFSLFSSFVAPQFVIAQTMENSTFTFSLQLRGVGKTGNMNPFRVQRTVVLDVYNSQNQLVVTRVGKVMYNATTGFFDGTIAIGYLQPGAYTVKVKTASYLQKTAPGIVMITQAGGVYQLQQVSLSPGDITDDNKTNVLDYNVLMGCYSDITPAKRCTETLRDLADFTDDGKVNQYDYNLFLRELGNRSGE